ncbi:MAG TPA: hypothetical protein VFN53_04445 [Acidobacteriaceae bacterium]|nr:hypothetical protein [Acidobacteriaceae bacterium]
MKPYRVRSLLTFCFFFASCGAACCIAQAVSSRSPRHLFFHVALGPQQRQAVSGRLLILVQPGTELKDIEVNEFHPSAVYVAAKDVSHWKPGESVDIDVDNIAYPGGFSTLTPGDYVA